ncbi:hypothetical protein ACFWBF_27725 [Streptomyces sp. NPDC060028]|uniref:hypothetical protein n=1 Tax=Streptomyces sp. NPDC060028 TaxID=3347041 RepID=UPI00368658C6
MIERARALGGHRVRGHRLNERMASNAKLEVRIVVHLADFGVDTDPVPENSAKQNVLAAAEGDTGVALQAWARKLVCRSPGRCPYGSWPTPWRSSRTRRVKRCAAPSGGW